MQNQAEKIIEDNDFVSIWMEENGNPAIAELTQLNLEVATKTTKALAEKVLVHNELALILDVNPEEVKRWLEGKHPFSLKILKEITTYLANNKS